VHILWQGISIGNTKLNLPTWTFFLLSFSMRARVSSKPVFFLIEPVMKSAKDFPFKIVPIPHVFRGCDKGLSQKRLARYQAIITKVALNYIPQPVSNLKKRNPGQNTKAVKQQWSNSGISNECCGLFLVNMIQDPSAEWNPPNESCPIAKNYNIKTRCPNQNGCSLLFFPEMDTDSVEYLWWIGKEQSQAGKHEQAGGPFLFFCHAG